MASKINGIIPTQNYEIIRDVIASILMEEIRNQEELTGTEYVKAYYAERFAPVDETEFTVLNIQFEGGEYSNKDQVRVDGNYVYYISVFSSSAASIEQDADNAATLKLHRVLGLIRAILSNPVYNSLGLSSKVIANTTVSALKIAKNDGPGNSDSVIVGYIEFKVRAIENVQLIDPIPYAGGVTIAKLYLTDKGFRYGPDGGEVEFIVTENSTRANPVYLIAE